MVDLITYVDRMPEKGETIEAPRFSMGFGGKGANQAVAAAMLAADVGMVGKVGDDMFGPNTVENLKNHGINVDFLEVVPGQSSGVAPIFVEDDGSNSILIIKGANENLLPADIDRARNLIVDSDLVVLQLEIGLETVYHAIDTCREVGVKVLLNPAPADPNLSIGRISSVDFFVPNETELKLLTGMPADTDEHVAKAARSLLEKGIGNIIVTMGKRGSMLVTKDGETVVPPIEAAAVDTTGAGDAFVGCFSVYFVETGDQERAIAVANDYAGRTTTRQGTQSSFITREEFESQRIEGRIS
jgi:ribokinase